MILKTSFILFAFRRSVLVFFHLPVTAQREADSLANLLKKHKTSDSVPTNILVNLAEKIRLSDPLQSIAYAGDLERMILSNPAGYKANTNHYLSAAQLIKGKGYLAMIG